MSGWGAGSVLRRQVRETLGTPGLGWLVGVTAAVPAVAVLAAAAFGRWLEIAPLGPMLLRAWFLPAATLVAILSAVCGATAIAGRAEAGVLDAMRRHGVAVTRTLAGKLAAAAVLGLALAATTLPAALLPLAFGRVPALDTAFAAVGIAVVAPVGAAVGLALGARIGEVRRAVAAAAGAMALLPLALAAHARFAPRVLLGTSDWAALVLFGTDEASRRLDVYLRLAALPLLGAFALLALCRAVAVGALVQRPEADPFGPMRRWLPGALGLAAVAVGFLGLR